MISVDTNEIKISPSVRKAISRLPPDKAISAVDLAKEIFRIHSNYAGGKAVSIELNDTKKKRLASEWINDIKKLFEFSSDKEMIETGQESSLSTDSQVLNSRYVVVGLCLLDNEFRNLMEQHELFTIIKKEIEVFIKQPIKNILTIEGLELYSEKSEIFIAAQLLEDAAETDFLKFSAYADSFSDFIRNKNSGEPLIIGIDAAWGMGKSTLMGMIKDRLIASGFPTVWFNAWKYDKEESLWSALVLEILSQTSSRIGLREKSIYYIEKFNKKMIALLIIEFLLLIILGLILLTFINENSLPLFLKMKIDDISDYNKWTGLADVILLFIFGATFYKDLIKPLDLRLDRYMQMNDYEQRIGFLANFSKEFSRVVNMIVKRSCVFRWDKINGENKENLANLVSGEDKENLVSFLWMKCHIDWINTAKIKKVDENTIKASADRKSLYLRMNNKKTKVILEGDDIKDYEFVVEIEDEGSSSFSAAGFKRLWSSDRKPRRELRIYEKTDYPLIVFIDDLDRCTPPQSADIIEAINLLLDAKNCVFILGMDGRAVASSIEAKYEKLKDCYKESGNSSGYLLGQRFLEKIIQIKFYIPPNDKHTIETFVKSVQSKPDHNKQPENKGPEDIKGKEIRNGGLRENAKVESEKRAFVNSWENSVEVGKAIRDALKYLESNPRKIKRFINLFKLQSFIANRRGLLNEDEIQLDLLAKWAVISLQWPELIQSIIFDKEFMSHFKDDKLPAYFFSKNIQYPYDLIEILKLFPKDKVMYYILLDRPVAERGAI